MRAQRGDDGSLGRLLLQVATWPVMAFSVGVQAFTRTLGDMSRQAPAARDARPWAAARGEWPASPATPADTADLPYARETAMQDFSGDDLKLFEWIAWFTKKGQRQVLDQGFEIEEGPTTEDELRGRKKQQIVLRLREGVRFNLPAAYQWREDDAKFVAISVTLRQRRRRDVDELEQEKVDALSDIVGTLRERL